MWEQFYYGVCYYPEHWDAKRHASDIRRIADCGFNFVRLGEGAWSYWEPEEGKFQFDMFDHVIDLCRQHKIKVVMGTPTYAGPAWVSSKYPEVLRWNFERQVMAHGSRRNFNYTSPKYRQLSDRLCIALAEHYKDEKQIIAWQLDNEFNCHMDVSYAPSDTVAFRQWLKEKYKSLQALNDAWGTKFWSQTYDNWNQLDLPHPTPTWMNPTQLLDETRFISDCVIRFAKSQAKILRKANPGWLITHNALFPNIDGPKFVKSTLDFFSHDQYPLFYKHGQDWPAFAANLQQARSLSFPFGLLEQQAGPGGQMGYLHATPRPGQMRLWAWQSVAHGAKLLSFFRWRTCPYGAEQHWHGLLDPDDRDNRRIHEAKALGKEIKKLPAECLDAPVTKSFAVLRDFDNETNDRRINTYNTNGAGEAWAWMAELSRRHFSGDFLWPDSEFTSYRVVVAPHLKIVEQATIDKLTNFVQAGGTLVLTAQSGLKDRNCHLVEMPLPGLFAKLAGIEVEDWTTLDDEETREVLLPTGTSLALNTFVELLKPIEAEVIARWVGKDSLLRQGPAVTCHHLGKGRVYYIGGYCPPAAAGAMLEYLADLLKIPPLVAANADIEVIQRQSKQTRFLFLLNHSLHSQTVQSLPVGREIIANCSIKNGKLVMQPYGVAILESNASIPAGE